MSLSIFVSHSQMSTINNSYSIRNRKLSLVLPKARTEYLGESFGYPGSRIWNDFPGNVKCSQNLNEFKRGLTRFDFQ